MAAEPPKKTLNLGSAAVAARVSDPDRARVAAAHVCASHAFTSFRSKKKNGTVRRAPIAALELDELVLVPDLHQRVLVIDLAVNLPVQKNAIRLRNCELNVQVVCRWDVQRTED